jgi:ubiquinone/menaquinone biosynthesis C-methylase UbiE
MAMVMYDREEVFRAYMERATEKQRFVERFRDEFPGEARPMRIVDFGSHDGTLTLRLLEAAQDRIPRSSEIICVDPSHPALKRFESKPLPDRFVFHFYPETIENFLLRSWDRFDYAIVSHSLYWSKDLKGVLKKIAAVSRRSVVVLREAKGNFQIQSTFRQFLGNPEEQLYTAADVEAALGEFGLRFKMETVESLIAIPERSDPAFETLASFFLQTTGPVPAAALNGIEALVKPWKGQFPHHVRFFWIEG